MKGENFYGKTDPIHNTSFIINNIYFILPGLPKALMEQICKNEDILFSIDNFYWY